MDDTQLTLFLIALFVIVVPLAIGLSLFVIMRLRRKSDQPLTPDGAGGIVVPVRGLKRYFRFFGRTHNSINPLLEIVDDGLRFRLFKPDHWRFADMVRVDAPWSPFITRLIIRHDREGELVIDLADKAKASDLLRALPPTMTFTKRAIAMRDAAGQ